MNARDRLTPYFQRNQQDPLYTSPIYLARIEEEFELIERFHFTKVFQQVHQILQIARDLKIPHIIRGSAGSSLICFLMGITEIDPILYNLELARFMNKGRTDLPDIDIDVPYNRREELYTRIAKKWPSMVARISNHVMYGAKVALRETTKEILLETIPINPALREPNDTKRLRALARRNFQLSKILPEEDKQQKAKTNAKEKEGILKHYSKHCGGIVIFEEEGKVPEELLLRNGESNSLQQIHLNKDETEDAGYIKIDILSNRGLAQLVEAQTEPRSLLAYPTRDPATERIFASGKNLGLTFGESRGMRKLFLGIRPRHMDDIAIALALIRPAAASRGRKAEFLDRWRNGAEQGKNPLNQQILFDDDAISMVRTAIGCDSAEADKWRKVFAKQNPAGRIQFRQLLYKKGVDRQTQDFIMSELDYLALYSFCKSHAISYAQLVWALAYEKAHNPHRFWCATLNHCHSEFRKWVHYREARCAGIQLTREKGPYRLGQRKGQPALISIATPTEQQLLWQTDPGQQSIRDMKEIGYWLSEFFLPGCGIWPLEQQRLERWFGTKQERTQTSVRFRGIIATGRILRRDGLVSLLTIGVDNERFIDLVFPDVAWNEMYSCICVEGQGRMETRGCVETIQVETIRSLSLTKLLELKKTG